MPRKSKQRGDKYGPVARRRRGQRPVQHGHEARQGTRVAMTLDDLMEGYSEEEDGGGGGGVLRIGGVAIRTAGDGGIQRVRRRKQGAHSPELGSPEGGVTLESGAWGEHSASSTDGEESGLADFVANLAANRGSDEDYDGLEDAMQRFARTDIGAGAAPEDARGEGRGLDGAGSSGSSEDTSTTEAASDAAFSPSDSDGGGGGGRAEHGAAMEALFPGSQPKRRKALRGGAAGRVPPGEARAAKKARKAALQAARSEGRGFSLATINSQLHDFVAADGDLMGLPTRMGKHEGAAVQRLAALYGLKCTAQGSGKKLTIMVASTRHTVMPEGEQAERVRELLWRQAALSKHGGRIEKLPPGTRPPGQAVQQRSGGGGGRGGGRSSGGGRGGRGGGGKERNWKARFGARPDGAPPPTPAYLQPMAFVSHGTLQSAEQQMAEATWGFRQQGVAAMPSAVLAAAAASPLDDDPRMSQGEEDVVADATQGLGMHHGLGFASADSAAAAAPAAVGSQAHTAASTPLVARAAAASAAATPGSGAASIATAYLADSNDSSSDDDSRSEVLGSSDGAGQSPQILYEVAYGPGLGGSLGGGSAPGLGFSSPTAGLGSAGGFGAGGLGAPTLADAAPAREGWLGVPASAAVAAADSAELAATDAAMDANVARGPAAAASAPTPQAPAASLRWFDGADDGRASADGNTEPQRQQSDAGGLDQSSAQQLRDLARAAAERRAVGSAAPMQAEPGSGRRPAIGLMTPNETAAQVRKARKKEQKLARRAAREAKVPGAPTSPTADTAPGEQQRASVAARYGGFEAHTTGFGSRMMARWGFGGAGTGLGASQQGIAEPIAAVQRGKGVGLGAE